MRGKLSIFGTVTTFIGNGLVFICMAFSPLASADCVIPDYSGPRAEVQINSRKILIAGWNHLSPLEARPIYDTLMKEQSCDLISAELQKIVQDSKDDFSKADRLYSDLAQWAQGKNVKAAYQEIVEDQEIIFRLALRTAVIQNKCNADVSKLAVSVISLLIGPVERFARDSYLTLGALETEESRSQAMQIVSEDRGDQIKYAHIKFKPEVELMIKELSKAAGDGAPVSDADVDRIASAQGAGEDGEAIRKLLKKFQALRKADELREEFMAKTIYDATNVSVATMGANHVRGILIGLKKLCGSTQ